MTPTQTQEFKAGDNVFAHYADERLAGTVRCIGNDGIRVDFNVPHIDLGESELFDPADVTVDLDGRDEHTPVHSATRITFEDRAATGLKYGIPVTPLNGKVPLLPKWPETATLDARQVAIWNTQHPDANCGMVAKLDLAGFWCLEVDSAELNERYKRDTGKNLPSNTLMVQSGGGAGHAHRWFRHTPASIAMGNIKQEEAEGFSVRANNQQAVGPLSVHPDTRAVYTLLKDVEPTQAPDELVAWLIKQKTSGTNNIRSKTSVGDPSAIANAPIPSGSRNSELTRLGGKLHHSGLSDELVLAALLEANQNRCNPPLSIEEVRVTAKSVCRYSTSENVQATVLIGGTDSGLVDSPPQIHADTAIGDMSQDVLDGRLGEIYWTKLKEFPLAYGWPALISAAGVMVPLREPVPGVVTFGEQMTNFFCGLIGPVHSGKSQAISWANQAIGLHPQMYSQIRAASSEGLLKKLHNMHKKGELMKSLFVDLDEWQHLFDKAGIEHASFASFLQTAFYKKSHSAVLGGGYEVELSCALTFVGGIVEDMFAECFGPKSMGGLHDRFMFGLCPSGYNFLYRPFEGPSAQIYPTAVTIAGDVWEMIAEFRKSNPAIGREAEIAVRVANVCAAFDGRSILHAKDCEKSVKAFIAEQLRIRDILKPNDGQTTDAIVSNAIVGWLRQNSKPMEIVPERKLRHGVRRTISKFGPGALHYATTNLVRLGVIQFGDIPGARPYSGRMPKGYMLMLEN